jgi:cytochrome c-type biogenesis protein CcmF
MGVGPLARWKKASLPELAVRLRWAFAVSALTALVLPLTMGRWSALVSFGLLLAVWIAAASIVSLRERIKHSATGVIAWKRLSTTPRAYYGMLLAHLGIAAFVVGVTLVKGYELEKDVRMQPGDTVELLPYTFRLDRVEDVKGPNYGAVRATIVVTQAGRYVTTLEPEKRIYAVQDSPMTEAAIDPGVTRDLYVSLGDPLGDGVWLVRVYYKPFVSWIWAGCLIMAIGGLLAATDRRYRTVTRRERQAAHAREVGTAHG